MTIVDVTTIAVMAALLFFGRNLAIRALARIPFRWTFTPANTFCLVVTEKNKVANDVGGGNIVDVLHGVPGKTLNRKDRNPMKWYFEDGPDPDHETYSFKRLGVQDMGSIFYTLRTNVDKRDRYAREKEHPQEGLKTVATVMQTEHVYFSGDMEITIENADTADRIGLHFKINFVFERKFPARSVLRIGDAPAFLASKVKEIVNNETSIREVLAYYGGGDTKSGTDTKTNRENLAHAIDENDKLKQMIENELGLDITSVAIHDVNVDDRYKQMLDQKIQAEKAAEASKITVEQEAQNIERLATANNKERELKNTADATRVKEVLLPMAENEKTVAVRFAESLENNDHLTSITYAPGSEKFVSLGK